MAPTPKSKTSEKAVKKSGKAKKKITKGGRKNHGKQTKKTYALYMYKVLKDYKNWLTTSGDPEIIMEPYSPAKNAASKGTKAVTKSSTSSK